MTSARAAALASCLLCAAAHAQQARPLWEIGVAAGALTTPAYPAAEDRSTRALALPYAIYRGKVMRLDQSGLGARLVHTDRLEFDVGLAASLPASSEKIAARSGMPDLGLLGEFGPRIKYTLARRDDGSLRIELPVRTVIEARGGLHQRGWTAEPRLAWESGDLRRLSFGANLSAVYGDAAINRYFYEVAPRYATAWRPAYAASAGFILLRAGLSGSYALSDSARLYSYVRAESYAGSANAASPLYRKRSGASFGLGLTWSFARSAHPAAD